MPIFMDRHDLPDVVTAEHVAGIHQADLEIEHEFGCKGLTYWFDDNRNAGFCLIEAPNKEALVDMHNKAHGGIPTKIIEVDDRLVDSFLGRLKDPQVTEDSDFKFVDSAFRTLMVINSIDKNEESYQSIDADLSDSIKNIKKIIQSFDGNIVKMNNQSLLVSFSSVVKAVHCAIKLSIKKSSSSNKIKIGLNAGQPVDKGEKLFEETILLAKRLCKVVKGDVIVSSKVMQLYIDSSVKDSSKLKILASLNPEEEIFLSQFIDYIEKNYTNPLLKVEDLNKALGKSNSQLYRKLIDLTGKSPSNFLKELRLFKALDLIKNQKGNISQIAFETGFNSLSYFSKCFQKLYGILPSEYQKSVLD